MNDRIQEILGLIIAGNPKEACHEAVGLWCRGGEHTLSLEDAVALHDLLPEPHKMFHDEALATFREQIARRAKLMNRCPNCGELKFKTESLCLGCRPPENL